MSVVGFDLGNENFVVAVARQREINVVLNDESKCETPAIVCFGEKQRFFGTAGAASSMMNPKNTLSQIKRLIGRPFSDPELQQDLKALPFSVTKGPDGFPLIHAQYLGETKTFTPTQVMGMVFSNMKTIADKNLNAAVVDCCIGIPIYFTDLQRRAVMDAATIAGLHPLRLMHETTATALAYGIYKTDLPENEQLNVAFVDIGHASMQVCIAGFKKGQLKILAHSFDRCLGGRDFDEALFQHFAEKFKAEYKIDLFQNSRACLRLRAACEKLKKVLSENTVAPMNIECLMDDKAVRGFIKRDEFEQISTPILERVKKPLEKALSEAQLTVDNIYAVEVVGSGSRVPAVIKILTEFFGKVPRRTMNTSECVSKGCALQCSILSQTFKVQESFPFSIALTWKGSAQDSQNGNVENQQSRIVFPKGNPIRSVKALTFYRTGTFTVDLQYADASELQAPPKISTYTIGPIQTTKGERAKVKVKVRLNLHGIVSVESAQLVEEEEVEVPVSKEPSKMDMDKAQLVEASKKKVKKSNIPVSELVYGAMLPSEVRKAVEKEFEMALQDQKIEVPKDKMDTVEAYVCDMRNKLIDEEKVEVVVSKEPSKMDMGITPAYAPSTNEINMQDVSVSEKGTPDAVNNPASSDNNLVHAKTNEGLEDVFDNIQQQYVGEENEDNVTSSTSTRKRSNVWDCFEQLPVGQDGVKRVSCIACGKVYLDNRNSGTSNMKRHMLECFNFKKSRLPPKHSPLDQAMYREKMAIAIIKHNYPFSYVEHDATRQLHQFLHRDANPITRDMARADVIRIYEREKTTLKQKLGNVTSRICLTSNLWSSITTNRYMALTAHYVDENWVLRKKVLNFRAISPPPYSGPILAEYMIKFLRDWGIEHKIFTITLGNAKYHDGLVDSLRGHLCLNNVLVCDGDYMHVRCGVNILTFIVQAGLKTIEGSIEKVRDSVKYIIGSFTSKLKFAGCIAQLSLQCGRHMRQDIITRWTSTYLMLDCALIYRHAYVLLEQVDSNFKTNLSQEEWTRVAVITKFLKPFYDITTLFSESSYPTSNLYFQKVWKIQLSFQEEVHNSDPIISKMAKDMKTEFDEYWESYSMILSFAVILDPRYKFKLVEYCFSKLAIEDTVRKEKLKSILDGLDKLYKEYEIVYEKMHESSIGGSSNAGIDPLDDLDGFESFQSQFGRVEREKSQLKLYLEEPELDRRQNIDILQFWKDNEWRYPQLALMARDILSIPITTVASDSSFSIGGHLMSKHGSSLLSPEIEALLCARDWLFDVEVSDEEEMEEGLIEDIEALIPKLKSTNH